MSQTFPIRGTKVTSPYPVQLTPAEHRLIFSLQKIFPPENIFADYYLPKPDSRHRNHLLSASDLLQIDCLAYDERGIFVFESKDYAGWIYAHGGRRYWTQVLNFGAEKNQFYNPIRQNSTHISALRTLVKPEIPIHSLIVFGRDTTLKVLEDLPADCRVCTQANLRNTLQTFTKPILSSTVLAELSQTLNSGRIIPTQLVRNNHVAEVQSLAQTKN